MTMRKVAVVALIAAGGLFAQRGGGGGGAAVSRGGYGISPAGFGNSLFPGGVPGHATNLGATVRGVAPTSPMIRRPGGGFGGGGYGYGRGGNGAGRTIIVPYAVPMYYGGGYGYGYDPSVAMAPPEALPPQQPPVVILNQGFRPDTINPQFREYNNLPEPGSQAAAEPTLKVYSHTPGPIKDDKPTIFLIAMKDGNIMPALSYWVDGDTLNYLTRDSDLNRISLDRVDKQFSIRLNEERGLEFRLPAR